MLESVGFVATQIDNRRNPRNDYTDWASFLATKPAN
jgi:hypothetical protein